MARRFLKLFTILATTMFSHTIETFCQNYTIPDNRLETKVGWEIHRHSLVAIIGYNVYVSKDWSIVPELNYVVGLTGSGSLRYEHRIEYPIYVYGQGGIGVTPILLRLVPTGIIATGVKYKLGRTASLLIETRILFLSDLGVDWSVGGTLPSSKILNVRKFPPWVFSLGLSF